MVPTWRDFPADASRVWSRVPLGNKQLHLTVKGDAPMAVYVYGGRTRRGYATTGVCNEGTRIMHITASTHLMYRALQT